MFSVAHSLCLCCWAPCVRPGHYRDISVTGGAMAASPNSVGPAANNVPHEENPRVPFASSTPRLESITQLHAAAVNGEKQVLGRLIAVSGAGELDMGDQFGRNPLMYCVLADRLECAELLLKAGSQVNFRDKGGRTALHWASHKGNYRLMKLLLSRGADCREKDNEGQTPLHLCTRHKLPKCMAMLLRQLLPGEIDNQDNNKRTALHWASSYGNLEHVKMLIKQDSNIGIPDIEGKTPLHWAASSRDPEAVQCVRLILETTPSVINWQDYEGRTALHLAVADGNQSIVDLLTSVEKCNVSALDNVFRTPLHWAAVLGHSSIVGQLLQSNADSTSSDSNGATPLHYAAQNNFDQTVNVFLSWKNTDEADLEGRTAFMWAAGKGADNVLRVFFHHGVDVQQEDKTGGTALHAAAFSGHAATVQLLLQHGARINATDQAKHMPLFRACEMGHTDVAQALIDNGARVDVLDEDGRSPLHWAALGGHAYICQILIKYGVDPNIRDHSGRTPLHCAAYGGYVNCMSALMEHQADPNTQDKEGMASLHWACSKGHLDAVKLLVENDAFPNHMEFREERYTPLDYALMGEHHDVAQYMIEQGALSITGIQDIAATKIQSAFRGYRVQKTFIERKKLFMKHEMLKKEAARKRAGEGKKSEELLKKDTEEPAPETPVSNSEQQSNTPPQDHQLRQKDQQLHSEPHPQELQQQQQQQDEEQQEQEQHIDKEEEHDPNEHEPETQKEECLDSPDKQDTDSQEKHERDQHFQDSQYPQQEENEEGSCINPEQQENPEKETNQEKDSDNPPLPPAEHDTADTQDTQPQEPQEPNQTPEDSHTHQQEPHDEPQQQQQPQHHPHPPTDQPAHPQKKEQPQTQDCSVQTDPPSQTHHTHKTSVFLLSISPECIDPIDTRPQNTQHQETKGEQKTEHDKPQQSPNVTDERLCEEHRQHSQQSVHDSHKPTVTKTGQEDGSERTSKDVRQRAESGHRVKKGRRSSKEDSPPKRERSSKRGSTRRKKEAEASPTEKLLQTKAEKENVRRGEKDRRADFQRKQSAASTIQRAWRRYRRTRGGKQVRKRAEDWSQSRARLVRLRATQQEWERQVAALTIQLAWRKFFRRKLLRSLNPNRRLLQMWDPEVVALKQQALMAEIYTEQLMVPFWHPTLKPPVRPCWFHLLPSPAAVSFNFAVDQYHPLRSWQGMRPHSWTGPLNHSLHLDGVPNNASSFRPERSQNSQFSYNLRKT